MRNFADQMHAIARPIEKLQELLPEIVRTAFQLVPLQVEMRKQREAAAVVAQKAAEVRALRERRANARAEQLKQAFQMADVEVRVRQLTEFLERLEQTADERPAPPSIPPPAFTTCAAECRASCERP